MMRKLTSGLLLLLLLVSTCYGAAWLKQSTAVDIGLGPFLDDTDGKTAETALTLAQADVRLKKNNGNWGQKGDATSCTHEENGWYECPLNTTDTGTLGILILNVSKTGALPVWKEFLIVPANVYDSIVAGSDALQVDTIQISGTAQTARDLGASVLLSSGTGAGQISLSSGAVTVGTNNDKTGYTVSTVSDKTGYSLTQAFPTNFSSLAITVGGAVTAGTVSDKTGYTVSTVSDKTGYSLSVTPPTGAEIADAVWDEAIAGHAGAGSTGAALSAAIGDPWATALPGAYAVGTAGKILGSYPAVVLPVMQGTVYTAVAVQGREVVVVQSNTPRIPFELFDANKSPLNCTGWTAHFAAKTKPTDTAYAIALKDAVWTNAAAGEGYVDLTAAEVADVGKLFAEIELRNGSQVLTAIKFTLKIIDKVID